MQPPYEILFALLTDTERSCKAVRDQVLGTRNHLVRDMPVAAAFAAHYAQVACGTLVSKLAQLINALESREENQ